MFLSRFCIRHRLLPRQRDATWLPEAFNGGSWRQPKGERHQAPYHSRSNEGQETSPSASTILVESSALLEAPTGEGGDAKRAPTSEPKSRPVIDVAAGPSQAARPEMPGVTEFWRQLPHAELESDTRLLRFRAPVPYPRLGGLSAIYVRKCYEQLYGFVRQMPRADKPDIFTVWGHQYERPQEAGDVMSVTGSPGMGKSVWILYLAWELAKDGKTVVLQSEAFQGLRFLLTKGEAIEGDSDAFTEQLKDMEAFYLVDGLKPAQADARTIVTDPPADPPPAPNSRPNYGFIMRRSSYKTMPPWTLEELEQALELYGNRTKDQMRAAFGIWGGSPSCMYWDDLTAKKALEAVKRNSSNLQHPVGIHRDLRENTGAPVLLHAIPDAELKFSHYDVASMRIGELAVEWAYAHRRVDQLEYFLECTTYELTDYIGGYPVSALADIRATLWRPYVLRAYSEGRSVKYRTLQQPRITRWARYGPAAIKLAASLDEVVKEKLWKKKKAEPRAIWRVAEGGALAASSVFRLPNELCLMTTGAYNPILPNRTPIDNCGLEKALTVLSAATEGTGKEPWITWIVPLREYDVFDYQELNLETGASGLSFANVKQRVMTFTRPAQAAQASKV